MQFLKISRFTIEDLIHSNEAEDSADSNTEATASSSDGSISSTEDDGSAQAGDATGTATGKTPAMVVSEAGTSVCDSVEEAGASLDITCRIAPPARVPDQDDQNAPTEVDDRISSDVDGEGVHNRLMSGMSGKGKSSTPYEAPTEVIDGDVDDEGVYTRPMSGMSGKGKSSTSLISEAANRAFSRAFNEENDGVFGTLPYHVEYGEDGCKSFFCTHPGCARTAKGFSFMLKETLDKHVIKCHSAEATTVHGGKAKRPAVVVSEEASADVAPGACFGFTEHIAPPAGEPDQDDDNLFDGAASDTSIVAHSTRSTAPIVVSTATSTPGTHTTSSTIVTGTKSSPEEETSEENSSAGVNGVPAGTPVSDTDPKLFDSDSGAASTTTLTKTEAEVEDKPTVTVGQEAESVAEPEARATVKTDGVELSVAGPNFMPARAEEGPSAGNGIGPRKSAPGSAIVAPPTEVSANALTAEESSVQREPCSECNLFGGHSQGCPEKSNERMAIIDLLTPIKGRLLISNRINDVLACAENGADGCALTPEFDTGPELLSQLLASDSDATQVPTEAEVEDRPMVTVGKEIYYHDTPGVVSAKSGRAGPVTFIEEIAHSLGYYFVHVLDKYLGTVVLDTFVSASLTINFPDVVAGTTSHLVSACDFTVGGIRPQAAPSFVQSLLAAVHESADGSVYKSLLVQIAADQSMDTDGDTSSSTSRRPSTRQVGQEQSKAVDDSVDEQTATSVTGYCEVTNGRALAVRYEIVSYNNGFVVGEKSPTVDKLLTGMGHAVVYIVTDTDEFHNISWDQKGLHFDAYNTDIDGLADFGDLKAARFCSTLAMIGYVAQSGCLPKPVPLCDIWDFASEFNEKIPYVMGNYKNGQNCMAFCVSLASFMEDPSTFPFMGDRDDPPAFETHAEFSVTLLDSAQQVQGSNDCGPAMIQHMYCEAFGRHQRIDSRNLNGSGYRENIKLAIQQNSVIFLNPSITLTEEEQNVISTDCVTLHAKDWESLGPSCMLEDSIVTACGVLIVDEISRLVAEGALNTGTVFITDSLFASCVLDTELKPSDTELKFVKPQMFRAAKVMIPVVRNSHWYLYVYSQSPYPSCIWSPTNFRVHDSCRQSVVVPDRFRTAEILCNFILLTATTPLVSQYLEDTSTRPCPYANLFADLYLRASKLFVPGRLPDRCDFQQPQLTLLVASSLTQQSVVPMDGEVLFNGADEATVKLGKLIEQAQTATLIRPYLDRFCHLLNRRWIDVGDREAEQTAMLVEVLPCSFGTAILLAIADHPYGRFKPNMFLEAKKILDASITKRTSDARERLLLIPITFEDTGVLLWARINVNDDGPVFGVDGHSNISPEEIQQTKLILHGVYSVIRTILWHHAPHDFEVQAWNSSEHRTDAGIEFIAERLSGRSVAAPASPGRSVAAPESTANPSIIVKKVLQASLAAASTRLHMPLLTPEVFRHHVVDDLTYFPQPQCTEIHGANWVAYCRNMRLPSTYGGQLEIQAVSAMYDCPVVVFAVPDNAGPLSIHCVCGKDTGGLPVFLLLFNPDTHSAHYCLAIPSDIAAFENERQAARHLVHCDPVSLRVDMSGFECAMDIFGIPGDGACLFSTADLAMKARSLDWQEGGQYWTGVLRMAYKPPSAILGDDHVSMQRLKVVTKLWKSSATLRDFAVSGGHALVESRPIQSLHRNLVRDGQGVGLSEPYAVLLDIGSGTMGILLTQSHLHPNTVCIGVESSQVIYETGLSVHRLSLGDGSYDGNMVSRCVTVDSKSDFSGVTNVDLFDGSPGLATEPDLEHAKLLGKLFSTASIDEVCSVKCSKVALIRKYAEIDEVFRKSLSQFKQILLTGRQARNCNFNTMMFVRIPEHRQDRHITGQSTCRQPTCVQSMISASKMLLKLQLPRPPGPRPLFLFHPIVPDNKVSIHSLKVKDASGIKRNCVIGHLNLICVCTGLDIHFAQEFYHLPTGQRGNYVGVSMSKTGGGGLIASSYQYNLTSMILRSGWRI